MSRAEVKTPRQSYIVLAQAGDPSDSLLRWDEVALP